MNTSRKCPNLMNPMRKEKMKLGANFLNLWEKCNKNMRKKDLKTKKNSTRTYPPNSRNHPNFSTSNELKDRWLNKKSNFYFI